MNIARRSAFPLVSVLLVVASGCATKSLMDLPPSQRLHAEVSAVLGSGWPSPEYQRARVRLQQMGPEVDSILVSIILDSRAKTGARADALVLLADRGSALALPTLRSALQSENEALRSASVLGLNQLARTAPPAMELIRLAAEDRSRTVRLNALQSLDIRDVETIRRVLDRETDAEVRKVGLQLVSLAEGRGAPLVPDRRGTLRTASDLTQPQIVFRPVTVDTNAGVAFGDLRIELPAGVDIPLAAAAEVVGNVVPAFFSPDRSGVVFENEGRIQVVDIQSRNVRTLGNGIAPRLIPFTPAFIFLRERSESRLRTNEGMVMVYEVWQGAFTTSDLEPIGHLTVTAKVDAHDGETPVRWMVVSEAGDGFVLRGDNVDAFPLPAPIWNPAGPDGGATRE